MKMFKSKNASKDINLIKSHIDRLGYLINNGGIGKNGYKEERTQLNLMILSTVLGGELELKNNDINKCYFKFNLGTLDEFELSKLQSMLKEYEREYENPFFERLASHGDTKEANDVIGEIFNTNKIPYLNNWNIKRANDYIFGRNGKDSPIMYMRITSDDLLQLMTIKRGINKDILIRKGIVVGGISALAVGGVLYYNHKKNKEKEKELMLSDDDIDIIDYDEIDDEILNDIIDDIIEEEDAVVEVEKKPKKGKK